MGLDGGWEFHTLVNDVADTATTNPASTDHPSITIPSEDTGKGGSEAEVLPAQGVGGQTKATIRQAGGANPDQTNSCVKLTGRLADALTAGGGLYIH